MAICASAATPSTRKCSARSSPSCAQNDFRSAPQLSGERGSKAVRVKSTAAYLVLALFAMVACATMGAAVERPTPDPADWPATLAKAKGQTVYWYAWG